MARLIKEIDVETSRAVNQVRIFQLRNSRAGELAPIFITVDPERDSWQVLGEYVPHFHDQMIGLTGTAEEISAAAKAYRVYFARAEGADDESYLMDHTSLVYLMGREGQYLRHFTGGTTAREMAAAISEAF